VTVEDHAAGAEIHMHPGGQGVWQARMLRRLGLGVRLCCALTGEVGRVQRHLIEEDGIEVLAVQREGRGAAYVHDRRSGERVAIAEEDGDPLGRLELDELYGLVFGSALDSTVTILSGPAGDDTVPADMYRRLAADLRAAGATVAVDLAGERLQAAIDGGVALVKVSDEELDRDGIAHAPDGDTSSILAAMHAMRDRGIGTVIVTCASAPLLLLDATGLISVEPPTLEVADHRGAGDSLFAGVVSGLVQGETPREAITLGAAAGAINVTRHGLGSSDPETVARLRDEVVVTVLTDVDRPVSGRVTPDGLAALAEQSDPDPNGAPDPHPAPPEPSPTPPPIPIRRGPLP